MIRDAYLATRAQILELMDLHGDLVVVVGIVAVVAFFVYRWLDAR